MAAETFLLLNGLVLTSSDAESAAAMLDLAAGEMSEEDFAAWLRDHITPRG